MNHTLVHYSARAALSAGETSRTVDVIAASGAVNDYGYMVDPKGLDLARYAANPVVMYDHAGLGLDDFDPADTLPYALHEPAFSTRGAA